jgi:hypothetical protein
MRKLLIAALFVALATNALAFIEPNFFTEPDFVAFDKKCGVREECRFYVRQASGSWGQYKKFAEQSKQARIDNNPGLAMVRTTTAHDMLLMYNGWILHLAQRFPDVYKFGQRQ